MKNNINNSHSYAESKRLAYVRLLEQTIQHWGQHASVFLKEDKVQSKRSKSVVLCAA